MPKTLRARLAAITVALLALMLTSVATAAAATHHRHHRHHRHHARHHRAHHPRAAASRRHRTVRRPAANAHTAQSCAYADSSAASTPRSAIDAAVVCLVNQQRTSRGLPALHASWRLNSSAQGWTDTMVARGEFDHGTDFANRLSAVGYDWSYAGENIATGYDTPRQVVVAWMASTEHCRNILSPNYGDVGTGVVPQPISPFASGFSTWTQDFGLSMNAFTPSGDNRPANGCPYSI